MRTLPRAAQLFVVAVLLTGGILLVLSLRVATFDRVPLLVLVVTAMLCARLKLRLPTTKNHSTMSVASAVVFTSLLLLGPHPTMVVAVAGAWCQSTFGTRRPNPLYRTFFNIASLLLAVQAFGLVYRLAGGTVGHVVWPDIATPIGAATLAYFLVNVGTVAVAVALSARERIAYVWHHDFLWGAPSYFVAAGAAGTRRSCCRSVRLRLYSAGLDSDCTSPTAPIRHTRGASKRNVDIARSSSRSTRVCSC